MLKLFKVETAGEPRYFDSKRAAKHVRDELREQGCKNQDGSELCVLRGPDHRKGETFA